MTTKQTTTKQRYEKVSKILLRRVLGTHEDIDADPVKMPEPLSGGYAPTAIKLANGKVLFCPGGRRQGVRGVIDNKFNVYAYAAARALAELKIISHIDADAFCVRLRQADIAKAKEREIQDLKDSAKALGYRVVKEKASTEA